MRYAGGDESGKLQVASYKQEGMSRLTVADGHKRPVTNGRNRWICDETRSGLMLAETAKEYQGQDTEDESTESVEAQAMIMSGIFPINSEKRKQGDA